jgi:hypothetical protein
MRNLTYHPSILKVKEQCIKISPEKEEYFEHLEKLIREHPETGIPDSCLLTNGKTIMCYKKAIKVYLFSGRIRYERSQITAQYFFNDKVIRIFNLYFSA